MRESPPDRPEPHEPALRPVRLHVLGVSADGHLWRSIRYATSWRPFFDVESAAGDRGTFAAAACAQVGAHPRSGIGNLHIIGATTDGRLWHTVRSPNSWQPFVDVGALAGDRGYFTDVACAEVAGNLHVIGITVEPSNESHVWHAIRYPDSWQPFNDVEQPAAGGERGHFYHVSCAGVRDNLHVCAVSLQNGRHVLWHAIRFPSSWQPFFDVGRPSEWNIPFDVACAGIGDDLHVCATTDTYVSPDEREEGDLPDWHLWHTIRYPNTWQSFRDVELDAGDRGDFIKVACTGVNT